MGGGRKQMGILHFRIPIPLHNSPILNTTMRFLSIVIALGLVSVLTAETATRNIGSRRELFVDDYLIEKVTGVSFRLHHPQPRELVWKGTNQVNGKWWGGANRSVSVFRDGPIYRMYYRDYARVSNEWII